MIKLLYGFFILTFICFHYYWIGGILPLWLTLSLLIIFLNKDSLKANLILSTKPILVAFLVFSTYCALNKLLSSSVDFDLEYILNFFVIIGFITCINIGYKISLKYLIYVLTLSVLLHSIFVIGQIFSLDWAWDFTQILTSNQSEKIFNSQDFNEKYYENIFSALGRVKGTCVHIHVFSSLIASLSIFLFIVSIEKVVYFNKISRLFIIIIAISGLACIYLTFTRSAILASLIILFLYYIRYKKLKRVAYSISVSIFVIFILTYLFDSIHFRVSDRILDFSFSSSANKIRIGTYKASLDAFINAPIFGGAEYKFGTPAHNVLLKVLVKFGIIGLISYLIGIYQLIKFYINRRKININKKYRLLVFLLAAVIFINLFNAMFHTNTYFSKDIFQPLFTALIIGQILREEHKFIYLHKEKENKNY